MTHSQRFLAVQDFSEAEVQRRKRGTRPPPFQSTYTVTRTTYPALTRASQVVRLSRRGDERLDNVAMVDLRLSRRFALGGTRKFTLQIEIFNQGNASTVVRNTPAVGTLYLAPAEILAPRVVKVGFALMF